MKKETFQILYFILFLINSIGIAGNIECDMPIPTYGIIIETITGLLVIGKMIYWFVNDHVFKIEEV